MSRNGDQHAQAGEDERHLLAGGEVLFDDFGRDPVAEEGVQPHAVGAVVEGRHRLDFEWRV